MPDTGVAPSKTYVRSDGSRQGSSICVQERDIAHVNNTAELADARENDIATALNNRVMRDGGNAPTADLPMAGYKHTGVGQAAASGQYMEYAQTNTAIAAVQSAAILRDGTQAATANIPMGSHKLTGLAVGSSSGDSATYGQLTTAQAACVARDGSNSPSANLPMGGYKHTGAAAANASGQYVEYAQANAAYQPKTTNLTRIDSHITDDGSGNLSVTGGVSSGGAVSGTSFTASSALSGATLSVTSYEDLTHISKPSAPSSGRIRVYAKSGDVLAIQNAGGVERFISPPLTFGGYLTLTSGTPIIATDVTAATTVYYTPCGWNGGATIPVYNGSAWGAFDFSELSLTLTAGNHLANTIYDVFIALQSGVPTIMTGPAWSNSGAGTGARGTGAGTTQLSRVAGLYTNAVQITGKNGANSYTITANQATYIGSIFVDGTAGQVSCHVSWGQSRKWGVWNANNRRSVRIVCGDPASDWGASSDWHPSASNSANSAKSFVGLPEEKVTAIFKQNIYDNNREINIGIGLNSTSTPSGFIPKIKPCVDIAGKCEQTANYTLLPTIGVNVFTCLEYGSNDGNAGFYGGESNMQMSLDYLG